MSEVVPYTLLWCYSFEPGYDTAYTLLDVVLFKDCDIEAPPAQVLDFLANEEAMDSVEEEERKIIFLSRHFKLATHVKKLNFLMAALYPVVEEDEEAVVNLVFYPLMADWADMDQESERAPFLELVLKQEEEAQGIAYKVVDACNFVVRLATNEDGEGEGEESEGAAA
jgi:hypothetical protein